MKFILLSFVVVIGRVGLSLQIEPWLMGFGFWVVEVMEDSDILCKTS